jgi:hypothetical protein
VIASVTSATLLGARGYSVPIGEVVVAVGELLRLEIVVESNGWLELSGSMLVSGKEHQ